VPEGEFKPSPAHRLDKETSGVVVVAKTRQSMVRLTEMFTKGHPDKTYLALAKGRFQRDEGSIDLRLPEHQQTSASKQQRGVNLQAALTHWRKLAGGPEATLLELTIETGRTHQIRRHLEAIGHPVVGDTRYGDFPFNRIAQRQWGLRRMFLHSLRLAIAHPITGKRLALVSPLPAELADVLQRAGIQPGGHLHLRG
jgi:23S rRNA pseudouridine955/2504/2580 synthase